MVRNSGHVYVETLVRAALDISLLGNLQLRRACDGDGFFSCKLPRSYQRLHLCIEYCYLVSAVVNLTFSVIFCNHFVVSVLLI